MVEVEGTAATTDAHAFSWYKGSDEGLKDHKYDEEAKLIKIDVYLSDDAKVDRVYIKQSFPTSAIVSFIDVIGCYGAEGEETDSIVTIETYKF